LAELPDQVAALAVQRSQLSGWRDISSLLVDFAITTWDVAPDALGRHLPAGIEPDVFTLDDGRPRAFVSSVTFLNTNFFVRFAPFIRLSAHQTNYRAYVRCGGLRCVWFFGTSLSSVGAVVPRVLWGLPWARSRVTHQTDWQGPTLQRYEWDGRSAHGTEHLQLRGTGEPLARLDGFKDAATTQAVLTHPLVGFLRRRGSTVVTYSVGHAPLEMQLARPEEARFTLWEDRGLVARGQAPHSALIQRQTQYDVHLPPAVAGLGG